MEKGDGVNWQDGCGGPWEWSCWAAGSRGSRIVVHLLYPVALSHLGL